MDGREIQTKLYQTAQEKIHNYPCNNVRASEIGHPCERYIVLSITNWEDKKPHGPELQNIFDLGNALETETIRRLKEAGYNLLLGAKNFRINKPLITGREDIMIQDSEAGETYPCEIKGLSPTAFDSIDSAADMMKNKQYYIRKYPAQLQIYMLHYCKEKGFFILFNKVSGRIKVIDVELDYEYAEQLLQKAERIYKHIAEKTLPETIDDERICSDCPLIHICGAKIDRGETAIDTGELEELLRRREEIIPFVKEYAENQRLVKSAMKNYDRVFTANYFVQKKTVARKPFVVAGSVYTKEVIRKIGDT